jgi:uncharacterized protein YuzE
MKISLDLKADALYIKFKDGIFFKNKKLDNDTIIDLDKKGRILGIELLNARKRISAKELRDIVVSMPVAYA